MKNIWKSKWKWIIGSVVLLILAAIGYYSYSVIQFANRIQTDPNDSIFAKVQQHDDEYTPPKWEGTERVNILLLGGDQRGLRPNEIPRSDSILIASLDPVKKQAHLFSILRDTYVNIPGHGKDRINAALAIGGPHLAMKTVGELTGMTIQYYVYTDFEGFIKLVDSIGGIDFEVEKDMRYTDSADDHKYDINLKKGMQHLNGTQALQYVRFRHDALSDYSRTERQRKFLQAVAAKLQSTSSLIKLPKILNSVAPYIQTNLTISDMLKLASLGYECKAEALISKQLPPLELLEEARVGGASVITVNEKRLQQFVQETLGQTNDGSGGGEETSNGAADQTAVRNENPDPKPVRKKASVTSAAPTESAKPRESVTDSTYESSGNRTAGTSGGMSENITDRSSDSTSRSTYE